MAGYFQLTLTVRKTTGNTDNLHAEMTEPFICNVQSHAIYHNMSEADVQHTWYKLSMQVIDPCLVQVWQCEQRPDCFCRTAIGGSTGSKSQVPHGQAPVCAATEAQVPAGHCRMSLIAWLLGLLLLLPPLISVRSLMAQGVQAEHWAMLQVQAPALRPAAGGEMQAHQLQLSI